MTRKFEYAWITGKSHTNVTTRPGTTSLQYHVEKWQAKGYEVSETGTLTGWDHPFYAVMVKVTEEP